MQVVVRRRRGVTLVDITSEDQMDLGAVRLPMNIAVELQFSELNLRVFKRVETDKNNECVQPELVNIHLKDLNLSVERSSSILSVSSNVSYLEIDNNLDLDSQHPVILSSDADGLLSLKCNLGVDLASSDRSEVVVETFELIVGNLKVELEDRFIEELLAQFQGTGEEAGSGGSGKEEGPLVRLGRLAIHGIRGSLSYHVSPTRVYDKHFEKYSVLGVTSGGFEEATVDLKPFEKQYVES